MGTFPDLGGLAKGSRPGAGVVGGVHCCQLAGLAVMAVGIWTLALRRLHQPAGLGHLPGLTYILVVAGVVVMVTGALGCCATFKGGGTCCVWSAGLAAPRVGVGLPARLPGVVLD